jgi:uncharacterized protein YpmS
MTTPVQDARESILDKGFFEYWKLWIIILIAVTLANLLSAYIIAVYVSHQISNAVNDIVPSDDPSNSQYLDCVLSTQDITSCDSLLK